MIVESEGCHMIGAAQLELAAWTNIYFVIYSDSESYFYWGTLNEIQIL